MAKSPVPKVAAIHDLSGIGRCSLTAVIPVLTRRGIQVCPLPTALLSSQTDGYSDYYFRDLTDSMEAIMEKWSREEVSFDAIYSGFLGSSGQADLVSRFVERFQAPGQLVVVDPVMGDNGAFYGPYSGQMVEAMKNLCSRADLITPNYTEAAFLLNEEYAPALEAEELHDWCRRLGELGPSRVVITSVPLKEQKHKRVSLAAWDSEKDQYFTSSVKRVDRSYPGTGDIFTSLLTAALLKGKSFKKSVKGAESKIQLVIKKTSSYNLPRREGVLLEKYL
ncbi:MAG: pyridoxamine kinase [Spirochaetales bacterium]|nr:pyridoxamine kinase [Spirochaetales bacterium]